MKLSLRGRLILAASLTLIAFLGLTAGALDRAYREAVEDALRERLEAQVYTLLGAAEEDAQGRLRIPDDLPDPRMTAADSGLYAEVAEAGRDDGQPAYRWRSASLLGSDADFLQPVTPGQRRFGRVSTADGELFSLCFGILWEDAQGHGLAYTVAVAEEVERLERRVGGFRATLFGWLGGAALLLLLVQGWVLHWGLAPLRRLAEELGAIEAGHSEALRGDYPQELAGVTRNLNSLLQHSRANLERQRNRLGDLAHSLKTPLAVLSGALEGGDDSVLREAMREQLPRLAEIVGYQLQRAAAGGGAGTPLRAVPLGPVVAKLTGALHKVYREKGIDCGIHVEPGANFRGDEGDLMELLGNLLDNAFKYGRRRVVLTGAETASEGLVICVADDGPGIAPEDYDRVLRRGERGDQQRPGQGIGLGVVDEIVRLYGGRVSIARSELGGAEIRVAIGGPRVDQA